MAHCSTIYCLRDWFRAIETNKNETARKRRQASFSCGGWVWICFRQLGGGWAHSLPCLLPTHCCHPQHQGQSRAATEMSLSPFSWWGPSPWMARDTQYFKSWPSHTIESRKSWCCHQKKHPCHLIPTWYHVFHYINRSDCSISQIRGQFWIKTNVEKKKRQVLMMCLQSFLCWQQHEVKGWAEDLGQGEGRDAFHTRTPLCFCYWTTDTSFCSLNYR